MVPPHVWTAKIGAGLNLSPRVIFPPITQLAVCLTDYQMVLVRVQLGERSGQGNNLSAGNQGREADYLRFVASHHEEVLAL